MNRLENTLKALRQQNRKALAFFITAGDPDLATTLAVMEALSDNGADVIELGVPFSDPIADGPVIQRSSQRALRQQVHLPEIFKLTGQFRKSRKTPVVLMGYYNPIWRYGLERFVLDCKLNGVDGLIVADLPLEEGHELAELAAAEGVALIYLAAPEPGNRRTADIAAASRGFLYCISHYGATGEQPETSMDIDTIISSLRRQTDLPILLGFGIASPQSAIQASRCADGVIIGSWLIRTLEESEDQPATAARFAAELRQAVDGIR